MLCIQHTRPRDPQLKPVIARSAAHSSAQRAKWFRVRWGLRSCRIERVFRLKRERTTVPRPRRFRFLVSRALPARAAPRRAWAFLRICQGQSTSQLSLLLKALSYTPGLVLGDALVVLTRLRRAARILKRFLKRQSAALWRLAGARLKLDASSTGAALARKLLGE